MINHEYPAERLEAERRDSLLVCYCAHPIRQPLLEWCAVQCGRCGRKVVS